MLVQLLVGAGALYMPRHWDASWAWVRRGLPGFDVYGPSTHYQHYQHHGSYFIQGGVALLAMRCGGGGGGGARGSLPLLPAFGTTTSPGVSSSTPTTTPPAATPRALCPAALLLHLCYYHNVVYFLND